MTPESNKAVVYELVDAMLKSWWTIVAGLCFGLMAGLLAMQYIPRVYEAATKIRIAPQSIPDDFLRTTVTEKLTRRRSELEESIKRRSYMLAVLEENGGVPADEPSAERAIEKLRESLTVRMPGESYLFTLTLQDGEPQRAADLVNSLTRLYVEDHAKSRTTQAQNTRQTFDELADQAKAEFDVVDKELNEFNTRHRFETQGYLNANLKLLENGRGDLETNLAGQVLLQQRLQDSQGRRSQAAATSSSPIVRVPSEGVAIDPQLQRLAALEQELIDLQARYSDVHPTVVRKQRQIDDLKASLETTRVPSVEPDDRNEAPTPADPRLAALNDQIAGARRDLAALVQEEATLRREIAKIERRIERTPQVQSEFNELEERHRLLRDRYQDYKQKAERSLQSEFLEESQRGQRLEVIEWAVVPFRPIFPNSLHVYALGLFVGGFLFVGPLLLRQLLNPVIGSVAGMRSVVDVAVLVTIPRLMTVENIRVARRRLAMNVGLSVLSTAALAATAVTILGVERVARKDNIWHVKLWGKQPPEARERTQRKMTAGVPLPKLIKRRLSDAPDLVMLNDPRSVAAERFRRLKTVLHHQEDRAPQVIVVTSASPAEGKSLVSINLALAFASEGRGDVLLIDADLRRPAIERFIVPTPKIGFTELLECKTELEHVTLELENTPLRIIPAGGSPRDPLELLPSRYAGEVIATLRERYERIIIDTPPIVPFTDADVIGALSDGVLVVARNGVTRRSMLEQAVASVTSTQVLGTVLNDVTFSLADADRYYSADRYYNHYDRDAEKE